MAKNQLIKGDFHIHSKYSYDSNTELRAILEKASEQGMNTISITDHETMEGSLKAREIASNFDIEVWLGMEIATTAGDIIGLKLKEEVRSRAWEDVIHDIRDQGGIVILPHPYRGHKRIEELAAAVDIVEVFNGHDKPENVLRSVELARTFNKPGIAGSDAHLLSEIGNVINVFDNIMDFQKEYTTKHAERFEIMSSHIIRDINKKKFHKLPIDVLNFFR